MGTLASGGAAHRRAHLAQRLELLLARRRDRLERLADAQLPAGRLADLVERHAVVHCDKLELGVVRARLEDPEVGDDDGRAGAPEAEALARAGAVAVADRRREVELL